MSANMKSGIDLIIIIMYVIRNKKDLYYVFLNNTA